MINVAIVEDKSSDAKLLQSYLAKYEKETGVLLKVTTFSDGQLFLINYKSGFDIVFMDVEMPAEDGIETAKKLRKIDENIVIIFITAMARYAIAGYEVHAYDFALKPLLYDIFKVKFARALHGIKKYEEQILTIKSTESFAKVMIGKIRYVDIRKHYLTYHTFDNEIVSRNTISQAEVSLKKFGFVRINGYCIVNLKHVKEFKKDTVFIGDESFPVSRSRRAEFLKTFASYIGGIS